MTEIIFMTQMLPKKALKTTACSNYDVIERTGCLAAQEMHSICNPFDCAIIILSHPWMHTKSWRHSARRAKCMRVLNIFRELELITPYIFGRASATTKHVAVSRIIACSHAAWLSAPITRVFSRLPDPLDPPQAANMPQISNNKKFMNGLYCNVLYRMGRSLNYFN